MQHGVRAMAGALALVGLVAGAPAATAADRVVAVEGVAKGNADRRVEILVVVGPGDTASAAGGRARAAPGGPGAPASAAGARAPAAQGAKKAPPEAPQANGFSFTGLVWNEFPVLQSYNPAGQPVNGASALGGTYGPWSNVSGSNFRIQSGGTTTRCPSLVRECPGAQRNDGFNDVGWARLSNGTLGVTWSTSGRDEADMAINTRYRWSLGCTAQAGAFDLQSVFLHENGHVAGLGHSTDVNAVMYPSYQTARCALAQDDRNGIATLY